MSHWTPSRKSSLQTVIPFLSPESRTILVHNTTTNAEDVVFANNSIDNLFWCLCPKANLYIESRLPDVGMLVQSGCRIVVGTDSLASNNTLNVLDEIRVIKRANPALSNEELLRWATVNGAEALGLPHMGRLIPGKFAGLIGLPGSPDAADLLEQTPVVFHTT